MRQLLLVEPQGLWRRTLAAVVRDLQLADVHEALNLEAARERLLLRPQADALLLSLDGQRDAALDLLEQLRADHRDAVRRVPVIVLGEACDADLLRRLQALQVHRMLIKPFKLRQVLLAVAAIWPDAVPAHELQA